jgi:2-oxoglutarate dehydrogenase E1 component
MRNALHRLNPKLYLQYAGRDASAAPACGHMSVHIEEQKKLVNDAFEI